MFHADSPIARPICYPKCYPRRFTMKLTDKAVQNLRPKPTRYEVWEDNGLGVRVTPSGKKSWVYMYRFEGRLRRLTLGRYPQTTVAKAHSEHGMALEKLEKGIDPATDQVEENAEQRNSPTVKKLAELYIEKWAKPRKRTWHQDEAYLDKNVLPIIGQRKAFKIKRKDIIKLLDGIVARGSPVTANRVLEVVRKMYNFAIERDILEINPCTMIRAPGKENRRERVLSESEIKLYLQSLNKPLISTSVEIALQLLLHTAQRRGEIATMAWKEIDMQSGWWTIPPIKSKNGQAHRVPLTKPVKKLLNQAEDLSKESPWVFPSPRGNGEQPIKPGALTRAIARCREHLDIVSFGPHDLRRTAASQMASLGVNRVVIGKILNHADSSVTAVYDRHTYDKEKMDALNTWSNHLVKLHVN